MSRFTHLHDFDGSTSLTFYCGELPADEAISGSGHEPNGYFWEGLVVYGAPEIAEHLELDSEAGMFAAYGDRAVMEQLRIFFDGYLEDGERVLAMIREAEAEGFQFDD